jgi:uncharacterized RDD family membrane protein YckC
MASLARVLTRGHAVGVPRVLAALPHPAPAHTPLAAVASQLLAAAAPARAYVRPTAPLQRKSLLRTLFRRRSGAPAEGGAGGASQPPLSIFQQDARIPPDLQLPRPADPLNRIGAGMLDLALSAAGGALAGAITYGATGVPEVALTAGQGAALVLWALRDALGDAGCRSVGKAAFGLEVANWDGTLATPTSALLRSWYFLLLPAVIVHPLVGMSLETLLFFDAAALVLTPDARKAGDYLFGTRVVDERPGRALRVLDAAESAEVRALREEVEELAPGLLARREAGGGWYEAAQQDILASARAARAAVSAVKAANAAAADAAHSMGGGTPLVGVGAAQSEGGGEGGGGGAAAAAAAAAGVALPSGSAAGIFSEVRGMQEAGRTLAGEQLLTHRPPKAARK